MTNLIKNIIIFAVAMLLFSCDAIAAHTSNNATVGESPEPVAIYAIAPTRTIDGILQIQAVNNDQTLCANGEYNATCTVHDIDFTYAAMEPGLAIKVEDKFLDGHAVLDGWLKADAETGRVTLFVVEGWTELTESRLNSPLYAAESLDIMCVRAPCPTISVQLVNDVDNTYLHGLDYTAYTTSDTVVELAESLLDEGRLLVAGTITEPQPAPDKISQPAPDDATLLTVQALYAPASAQ